MTDVKNGYTYGYYNLRIEYFRLDPWATYVLPDHNKLFNHHFWNPPAEQVSSSLMKILKN